VIYGYKHANFWRSRDEYGLKRRVTVHNKSIFKEKLELDPKEEICYPILDPIRSKK